MNKAPSTQNCNHLVDIPLIKGYIRTGTHLGKGKLAGVFLKPNPIIENKKTTILEKPFVPGFEGISVLNYMVYGIDEDI